MDANSGEVTGKGAPAIIDGELTAGGIDRTTPAAEFADFLKSEDGIAFQSTAYQAAKALLSANAEELSAYMAEPSDAVRATRGLTDILGSIDDLILVTGIDSIKSENEISVSYRYSVTGEDSLSYVTMALRKIDGVWKVQWLGIEK